MQEPLLISRKPPESTALNFAELRRIGVEYFERVASNLWTDYNVHDPGITLLELLCYGITEIAYRATFPDADLFAPRPDEALPKPKEPPFITAAYALTNGPVTLDDYRKLFLDECPELRNVWADLVEETLFARRKTRTIVRNPGADTVPFQVRGLYRFRLLFHEGVSAPRRQEVIARVAELYHHYRNLCEDLVEVVVTPLEEIMVCAEIELTPQANIEETNARVLFALRKFLSPIIPRYTLAQLAERGLPMEEIFDGPRLKRGFILDSDLDASGGPESIRSSDLLAVILAVPGVRSVKRFQLNFPPREGESFAPVDWELKLTPRRHPRLTPENARLQFYKGPLPFRPDTTKVTDLLGKLEKAAADAAVAVGDFDRPIPAGIWRDLGDFTTLQDALPLCYGVGKRGFNSTAPTDRLAKARQLQAFLLIFDQLLANYLAQLTNLRRLFSMEPNLKETYFARAVEDLPDLAPILREVITAANPPADAARDAYQKLRDTAVQASDPGVTRRSQILDHLLARFGESFTDQVLLHFSAEGLRSTEQLVEAKRGFLQHIANLAYERLQGPDVRNKALVWDTWNVSGFENRVARLLGFPSADRRTLTTVTYTFFEEKDTDTDTETRFRIVDTRDQKTILSGTRHFNTKQAAEAEMRVAIRNAMDIANYRLKINQDGRHFFVVVNVVNGVEDIIAIRKQSWATQEEAATERDRIAQLIAREYSDEGMFLVEHILLRPRPDAPAAWPLLPPGCACVGETHSDSCLGPQSWDPYSFRVHIVFPAYTARFVEPGFRRFVEEVIRRELPAHLSPKICFVDKEQLAEFETRYRAWLELFAAGKPTAAALTRLLEIMNALHTIYPAGTLHDCKEDGDEASAIVLNQSRLGTLPPDTDNPQPPTPP